MMEALLTSSVLILALALPRRALRGRIDPRLQYGLWLLVALRLLIPGSLFPAPVTVAGALSAWDEARAEAVQVQEAPADETTQIPAGGTVLPVLGSLYDAYTEAPDLPSETAPGQPLQEAPGVSGAASGGAADRDPGPQAAGRDDSGWSVPFWRWTLYGGAALVGAALVGSNLRFYLSLRKRRRLIPPETLPVPCGTRVYLAEGLPSPCLAGLLRPAIYLNEAALDPGRLEHILVHEETHRRHGDQLWGLVRGVCLALYWYDPLVWWAAVLSRRDCELACDHSAIRRLGEARRLDYGQTLLAMVVPGRPLAGLLRTATTMTEGKRTMKERVALIVRRPRMLKITLAAVTAAAIALVALTFGGVWEEAGTDQTEDQTTDQTETVQPQPEPQPAPGITEAEALALYQEAREAWSWFEIGFLPTTGQYLETGYAQVDGFQSLDELEAYLLTLFTPELTDYLLTNFQPFQETADGLFVLEGLRGTSIFSGEQTIQAFVYPAEEAARLGDDGHIIAFTEVLDEDLSTVLYQKRHDWYFSWNGANYVFTSFGPWDDGDPQLYYNAQEIMARLQQGGNVTAWLSLLENMDWGAMASAGGEDYDLCLAVQGALYDFITDYGDALTADEYKYILSATEGLDGAYAEGYQYDVWRLYQAQPRQFAQVVLFDLTAEQSSRIVDFFRYEEAHHRDDGSAEPMTAEEALDFLRRAVGSGDLASATYTHSSGMFSLSLPEEWVNAVVYTETEDGVDFFEANTYAEAGYGWLASVRPQPASWVADHAGDPLTSLGGFDTNGVPQQYVLEYRMAWDFEAEPAAAAYEETARALLDLRDQIGFRLSVTPELISQLIHDSYGGDMADAIPFLPYLSWSSYRDAYGGDGLLALLDALGAYASSGRADWGQYHDILSAPVDSAIDGAYAEAYQEMVWSLYRASSADFSSVLLSDFITDEERDNAVYWLRVPMAWADGLEEPLSDETVRVRLGLIEAAEEPAPDEAVAGAEMTDIEMMNSIMRGFRPNVMMAGSPEDLEIELTGDWTLEGIRSAIFDALIIRTAGTALEGALTDVAISYSFQFPETLQDGVALTVPYTASYQGEPSTLPSGAIHSPVANTNELTATVHLVGQGTTAPVDDAFAAGQAAYRQLSACAQLPELEVPVSDGENFDVSTYLMDAIGSNLASAGLSDSYRIDSLSVGGHTVPNTLAPGTVQTIDFSLSFRPLTEDGFFGISVDSQLTVRTTEE